MKKSSVRVLAGSLARREIQFYEIEGLRPTPVRIRETLFNWLAPYLGGANCLDLFAGSGALGFEAISRGAKQVVFVEKHKKMAALIKAHADKFTLTEVDIFAQDYQVFLQSLPNASVHPSFDIVFLDPPYQLRLLPVLLPQITKLAPQFIYLEDEQVISEDLLKECGVNNYEIYRLKKAGQVSYALLKRLPSAKM